MSGTVIVELCFFALILVLLPGVIGSAVLVGYLYYVVFLALFAFIGLTIFTYSQTRKFG